MIDRIIAFALQQRLVTVGFFVILSVAGIWSILNIPIDSFPDCSNVQVQIITEPETMATDEVERQITFPIESALSGVPKIKHIRSNSSFGLSVVTAIFEDDTDPYFARELIQQRLLNQLDLPEGAPRPQLGPLVSSFSNVFAYYLTSDRHDLTELRTIQDWQVARRFRAVPGVGNVVSYGGFVKQYQVVVQPDRLKGYDLTLRDVVKALEANNSNAGGNFIEQGGEEIIIRGLGRIHNEKDIADIVLKSVNGTPVTIRQVAEVKIGPAFRRGSASMNGKGEAVTGVVMTRKGVNTKAVVDQVEAKLRDIESELPEGVKIYPYYNQTELVDKTIDTVKEILMFSGGMVVIVLFAFLLDIPSALIVSVIIPLSLLFSFILMKFTGLSANLMTLGAVDFGVIVDAGVVMVENIFRQVAHARSKLSSDASGDLPGVARGIGQKIDILPIVTQAAQEVGRPIVFAIFIIVSVYIPLFTLEGIEGKMFHPLALTFIYAILGALLVSLTLIPVLCFWMFRGRNIEEKHNPILDAVVKVYTPALKSAIQHPQRTLVVSLGALLVSFCLIPFLGSEFIPTLDEGSILLRTKLSPSVSHTESRRVISHVEEIVKGFPEVTVVVSKIGRSGMGSDLEGVDNADIYIGLKPNSEWRTTHNKEELVNRMAAQLDKVPGLIYSFSQPIADMIDDLVAGIKADLGIKVFGDDLEKIDAMAAKIQGIVRGVRGSADMQREQILGLPQMNISLKRDVIARYGLNVSDVQEIINTAIAGRVVSDVLEGTQRFGISVRYPAEYRDSEEDIEAILISTPSGARVPLKHLADIQVKRGTVMVNREDGQRRTAVLANVRGRDLGGFVAEAQERVAKEVQLPRGYRVVWGGTFENQMRAMQRLAVVVPVVLLLIFVLLFASFNSLRNASLIMLNVPFAMIGGFVGLFITHQTISVPAIIGFIALFGVAVQNGVIMVTYITQLQRRGMNVVDAAAEGAMTRLRPVLMTATVAIMGLLPKIISGGTGAEVQRPLAIVVLGGLVSATLLTLLVLPAVYAWINKPPANGQTGSGGKTEEYEEHTRLTGEYRLSDLQSPGLQ
ncbi:MAG: CusA/CzcA family heavy metal efflux RND transporter [Candidatus Obscuribacterales bacterium]